MITVLICLVAAAFICTIVSAIGKCPLWVALVRGRTDPRTATRKIGASMKRLIAVFILTLVASCASVQSGAPSAQQAVFAAKQDYAVALTAAVAYKRLPPCPTATKICKDAKVIAQLQKIDDASAALLDGAEATVRSGGSGAALAITAAQQAVSAFTSITKTLGSQ